MDHCSFMRIPRKKLLHILLFIMILTIGSSSLAEGLFPEFDVLFGTGLPSVELITGKTADEKNYTDEGEIQVFSKFGLEDYANFGSYLAGLKAKVIDYSVEDGIINVTIQLSNDEENSSASDEKEDLFFLAHLGLFKI